MRNTLLSSIIAGSVVVATAGLVVPEQIVAAIAGSVTGAAASIAHTLWRGRKIKRKLILTL